MSTPQLISFDVCPFVQRSAIALRHKGIPFERIDIDLADKPDWFTAISPLGKVPVLREGDEVLFESAVINEYLDETRGEPLMPTDPLARAKHRAWIEVGSAVLGSQYMMSIADSDEAWATHRDAIATRLGHVEQALGEGPYFAGSAFSLVDTAWAPFFTRLALLDERKPSGLLDAVPKTAAWGAALVGLDAVRASVHDDFDDRFHRYLDRRGGVYAAG